jgi:hypothetical protein
MNQLFLLYTYSASLSLALALNCGCCCYEKGHTDTRIGHATVRQTMLRNYITIQYQLKNQIHPEGGQPQPARGLVAQRVYRYYPLAAS